MNNKVKKILHNYPTIILLISLVMGVGYASINSIAISFAGEASMKETKKVFFTEVQYLNDTNADLTASKINHAYQTNLNSKVVLSNEDPNSSITYELTAYNSSDYTYIYDGIDYITGNDTYSNRNIVFDISIEKGTIIESKEYLKYTITFKYKDNKVPTNNELQSMLKFKFVLAPYVVDTYEYVGNVEEFIAPHKGIYQLEVWGAQGGNHDEIYYGGHGGYSYGKILLEAGQKLYVAVGEQGTGQCVATSCPGGYNGGGNSGVSTSDALNFTASGGGASHISVTNRGELKNYESNKSDILLVAGGGGGGYYHTGGVNVSNIGGAGGGLSGIDGAPAGIQQGSNGVVLNATGGTQTAGGIAGYRGVNGSFGQGGSGASCNSDKCGSSGGGGGYYGGGASGHAGTGGGSGYIGGVTEGVTIAGINSVPTYDGTSQMTGNIGNGYAKITFLKEIDEGNIYISDVKYKTSNNVDASKSQILSVDKTSLTTENFLSDDQTSSITYEVEIFNTTSFTYYYDDVYHTLGEYTYNNENITYTINGLNNGYLLGPNKSIKFEVTYHYKNNDTTNNQLLSTLNFNFIKTFPITYIGFENNSYPKYALENKPLEITFNNQFNEVRLKSDDNYINSSDYTFDTRTLKIHNVTNSLEIINVDNVQIIPDFSFSKGELHEQH